MSSPVPHRPPTDRGANVVVTVSCDDSRCATLQKALYLLGTYYNLFVIVDVSSSSSGSRGAGAADDSELRAFVGRVRSELLNEDRGPDDDDKNDSDAAGRGRRYRLDARVLPRHRIAFSNTSRGRVAFVRQLHGTELVIDHDGGGRRSWNGSASEVLVYPVAREGGTGTGVTTTTTTTTARNGSLCLYYYYICFFMN
ncbi:hypothetical protein ACHAW5_004210 [Stephanodiscus triporus]|uniref:Uncharacterized protein n=1 Tax=Stephanodiscus triporus TaxID=2934178 RepID=A0ABD3PS07_9STRA